MLSFESIRDWLPEWSVLDTQALAKISHVPALGICKLNDGVANEPVVIAIEYADAYLASTVLLRSLNGIAYLHLDRNAGLLGNLPGGEHFDCDPKISRRNSRERRMPELPIGARPRAPDRAIGAGAARRFPRAVALAER